MATRADFEQAVEEFYEWYWDGAKEVFGKVDPVYPKICDVRSIDEIDGSFTKVTSGVGLSTIPERDESEAITIDNPTEGYTVQIKKRTYDIITPASFELSQDFDKAKDFLKNYIKENAPGAIMRTKDGEIAKLFDNGFDTSGASVFNNSTTTEADPSGDLIYDSSPFFAKDGGGYEHTSKGGTDYYNALDAQTLSEPNLETAHNLLVDTNAKLENDEPFDNSQNKVIMVKPGKALDADRIINSTLIAESQNNDLNPLKGEYDVVSNPYLTNSNYWYIGRRGFGIRMYDMKEPIIKFWEDMDTSELRAKVTLRLAFGVINFRGFVGSDATS